MTAATTLPRSVLVVAANYWPEESGNAPYTTAFAEDLAAHGVEVTVLTAMPHYPQWQIRAGYRGRLRRRETRNGVQLVRSWLWVPGKQSALQRALFEGSFLLNTLTVRGLRGYDLVVGVMPNLTGAVLARVLARRFRVPYGLIIQDLMGQGAVQSGMRGGSGVAKPVRAAEAWAVSRAGRIAVVSPSFVPYLEALGMDRDRIALVRNWSDVPRSEANPAEVRMRFGLPEEKPVALHAGAMGLKQGLEQIVDAARFDQDRNGKWYFVLAGEGSQRRMLQRLSAGLSNIVFLPQQPVDDYADLLVAADVLLLSERPGVVDMSLPAKFSSYLTAGRPIVAAVFPDGATAAEVERSGAGTVAPTRSPDALLAAAERLLDDPKLVAGMRANGVTYAGKELDKDTLLARYRSFVAQLVAK